MSYYISYIFFILSDKNYYFWIYMYESIYYYNYYFNWCWFFNFSIFAHFIQSLEHHLTRKFKTIYFLEAELVNFYNFFIGFVMKHLPIVFIVLSFENTFYSIIFRFSKYLAGLVEFVLNLNKNFSVEGTCLGW